MLHNLIDARNVRRFDAFDLHKKFANVFDVHDVPEDERKTVARLTADKILAQLKEEQRPELDEEPPPKLWKILSAV